MESGKPFRYFALIPAVLSLLVSCKTVDRPDAPHGAVDANYEMAEAQRLYLMGEYGPALRPLDRILGSCRGMSAEAEAAYWAGLCLLKEGKHSLAEARLRTAVKGLAEPYLLGNAYVGLAEAQDAQGKRRAAEESYRKALEHATFIDVPRVEERLGLAGTDSGTPVKPTYEPPVSPSIPKGSYTVQVGAFESREAAMELVGKVRRKGYAPYVQWLRRDNKLLCCVRVGIYKDKRRAEELRTRLKAAGLDSFVVQ